jgi:hypothetical protein
VPVRACKAVFDPDLEQGGNTTVVVRCDPGTGDTTHALVHRWCSPTLYMVKALISGRGDEIIDLARSNLWR